jgi:predicted phosphohydrolase
MLRFQIHSDIHLEKYPRRRVPACEPNLILAGDIGVPLYSSYENFFKDVSRKFDRVVYVLGNHEYERIWMGIDKRDKELMVQKFMERNKLIQDILSNYKNISLLDNQGIQIEKKKIYGTTLWTNFWEKRFRKDGVKMTDSQMFLSEKNKQAIDKLLENKHNDLLITHYVSNRKVLKKPWIIGLGPSECFTSFAEKIVFGHIHYSIYDIQEKNLTLCNPWGEEEKCKMMSLQLD